MPVELSPPYVIICGKLQALHVKYLKHHICFAILDVLPGIKLVNIRFFKYLGHAGGNVFEHFKQDLKTIFLTFNLKLCVSFKNGYGSFS